MLGVILHCQHCVKLIIWIVSYDRQRVEDIKEKSIKRWT